MKRTTILVSFALASVALAQASSEARTVQLQAGESLVLPVGYARGVACDDPSVVSASMNTTDEDADAGPVENKVTFEGLQAGVTQCTVGNVALGSPRILFSITVTGKRHSKGAPDGGGLQGAVTGGRDKAERVADRETGSTGKKDHGAEKKKRPSLSEAPKPSDEN
jgi:hypothetical protein